MTSCITSSYLLVSGVQKFTFEVFSIDPCLCVRLSDWWCLSNWTFKVFCRFPESVLLSEVRSARNLLVHKRLSSLN